MVIALTAYAYYAEDDFTSFRALGSIIGSIFFVSIFAGFYSFSYFFDYVYLAFGVVLFGFYIIVDSQLIFGAKRYKLDEDEYIVAAMLLYIDIIGLFMYLLRVVQRFTNR